MAADTDREPGRFITIEGGEGSGKSTLIKSLSLVLKLMGEKPLLTREPGGTPGAEALRELLLKPPEGGEWSAISQTLLFYAARAQHLEQLILPSLQMGKWVVCDRFSDSTRAYQIVAGGLDMSALDQIDALVVGDHQPDLTFILDCPVDIAQKRRADRGGDADAFEKLDEDFHQKVRDAFLDIARAHSDRCVVIDASGDPEDTLEQCVRVIEERFD